MSLCSFGGASIIRRRVSLNFGLELESVMAIKVTQSLEAAQDYATALGHMIVASSGLEMICLRLFTGMLSDNSDASRSIFFNTANFRSKVELIKRTSVATLSADDSEKIGKLLDKAYKTYKKRNRFAHGVWGVLEHQGKSAVVIGEYDPEKTAAPKGRMITQSGVELQEIKAVTNQLEDWRQKIGRERERLFGPPPF